MSNPRSYDFDPNAWYWGVTMDTFALKTPDIVIKKGSIVNKDNQGKIKEWDILKPESTGVLYIVAEDTVKDVDRCVCICSGKVSIDALQYPTGIKWNTDRLGVTLLDSMALRSQIILV